MKNKVGAIMICIISVLLSHALFVNATTNNYWADLTRQLQGQGMMSYSLDDPNKYWDNIEKESLKAIEENEDEAIAYFKLGVARAYLGELQKAIDDFNVFEEIDRDRRIRRELVEYYKPHEEKDPGDNVETLYGLSYLAFAYYSDYRYSESIRTFKWLIEEEPDNPWHYAYLAYVYFLVDEPEKAHEAIKKAIDLEPNNDYLRAILALSYWEMGNRFRAFIEILKAPEIYRIVRDSM